MLLQWTTMAPVMEDWVTVMIKTHTWESQNSWGTFDTKSLWIHEDSVSCEWALILISWRKNIIIIYWLNTILNLQTKYAKTYSYKYSTIFY